MATIQQFYLPVGLKAVTNEFELGIWSAEPWELSLRVERPGFDSRQGDFSLFATTSGAALGPAQYRVQWAPVALSRGVKRPGRESDRSFSSSAEVKNAWSYASTHLIRLYGVLRN
jgi:hypothetical protein